MKIKEKIVYIPHFWLIIVITMILIFIYSTWPWRDWKFIDGVWQWFPWLSSLYDIAVFEVTSHFIGILFLLPIIYATLVFSWRGALVISLLSIAGIFQIISKIWPVESLITNLTLLMLPTFVVSIVVLERRWLHKEANISAEREIERQSYVSKVLESQENERRRIARELHDDTIQTLLVIANGAQNLITSGFEEKVKRNAEWIRDTSLQAVEDVRRISLDLRPSVLDDLGLVPALRWLTDRMNRESNIDTLVNVHGIVRKLSRQEEGAIFRISQEALNNVRRHSKATEAAITIEFASECLSITIEDNGIGFLPPQTLSRFATKGKVGLIGMRQRVNLLNGTFKIRSKVGRGTLISIRLPC